ncbi:MAG: hydroxymethylbilane synthase [Planctomycetaceae bacterium]
MHPSIRIATRSSRLALRQANHVATLLRSAQPDCAVQLVEVTTTGDADRSQPLSQMGGVGAFTREVQRAVLDGRADIAVHSLKDLPTEPAKGLILAAVPERASCFDALVLPQDQNTQPTDAVDPLDRLPNAAHIGTGSLRRQSQLLHARPDLRIFNVRGNVETRLRKLDAGEFDALILAEAGLSRLELPDRISARLGPPLLFPAVGQGALGIECRTDDETTTGLLQRIEHAASRAAVTAERAMLAALRAGCHAPVGVATSIEGETLRLEGVVLSGDGRERITADISGAVAEAKPLGHELAADLLELGAQALVDSQS